MKYSWNNSITEHIRKRPLAFFVLFFLISVVPAFFLSLKVLLIAVGTLACLFFVFLVFLPRRHRFLRQVLLSVTAAAAIAFFTTYICCWSEFEPLQALDGETVSMSGQTREINRQNSYETVLTITLSTVNNKRCRGTTELHINGAPEITLFDHVRFTAQVHSISQDPLKTKAEKIYAFANGEAVYTECTDIQLFSVTQRADMSITEVLHNIRVSLATVFDQFCQPELSGFLRALSLGDRKDMSPTLRRDFSRIGISHILAVSGLHFSILIGAFSFLLQKSRMHRVVRTSVLCILILFYMLLSGASPSVLRCGIMLLLYMLSFYFRAGTDSLTSLFFAAFILVLFRPCSIFDTGFLLSFSATCGIITLGAPACASLKRPRGCVSHILQNLLCAVLITVSAQIFTLPILAFSFHTLSALATVSNLIFEPFALLMIPAAPLLLLFSLFPPLAIIFSTFLAFVMRVALMIAGFLAKLPNAVLPIRSLCAVSLVIIFIVTITVLLFLHQRKLFVFLAYTALCICLLCVELIGSVIPTDEAVLFRNTKTSDTITLFRTGECIVIDSSDGSYLPLSSAFADAETLGATEIDALVLTHMHRRHCSTLTSLFKRYIIRSIYLPKTGDSEENEIFGELSDLAGQQGVSLIRYDIEAKAADLYFHSAKLTVLPRAYITRSDQPLVSLIIDCKGQRILYAGAGCAEGEGMFQHMFEQATAACDVLLIGEHGPKIQSITYEIPITYAKTIACAVGTVPYGFTGVYETDLFRLRIK